MDFRIGFGYDVHRFADDRDLMIGGIKIPYEKGLQGHSDADVLLHAICDALLGAANLRDIGFHFSDRDPKYKNIDSKILLSETVKLLAEKGYRAGNLDCTLVAEAPKMNPHIPDMQSTISELMQIEVDRISIKATTHEKMDAFGQGIGMAAYAVALIYKG